VNQAPRRGRLNPKRIVCGERFLKKRGKKSGENKSPPQQLAEHALGKNDVRVRDLK